MIFNIFKIFDIFGSLSIKIICIIAIVLLILFFKIRKGLKLREEELKLMRKDDKDRIGQRYNIKREGKKDIEVNLYIRNTKDNSPLLINIHGGAFISGDADTLDTQSERISKQYNVHVVTVNYKLLSRGINIDYQTEEIIDTIKFFYKNHSIYKVDLNNIFVLGYSAGGCLAMSAALKLIKMGIKIKGQILCYAYIRDIIEQFNKLENMYKKEIPSALFILADKDFISTGSLNYEKILKENGILTEVKYYKGAIHGFIEENNPEYEKLKFKASKSPEQEKMARDAEKHIGFWINKKLN